MSELNMEFVRVLVVDDDPVFIKLADSLIRQIGCQVAFACHGREALKLLDQYNFDICFMDIMMPEMNGVEAAEIIREDYSKRLPIIAVTSSNMKATKEKCLEVGMNDFVTKPIDKNILQSYIMRYALRHP